MVCVGLDTSQIKQKQTPALSFFSRLEHEIKICSYLRLQYVQREREIFPISHVVEYPMQCNDMSDRLKYKKNSPPLQIYRIRNCQSLDMTGGHQLQ